MRIFYKVTAGWATPSCMTLEHLDATQKLVNTSRRLVVEQQKQFKQPF